MKRSEQTESVKVRLYKLTEQFTRKYVWRYFKQFNGDLDDLIMEYYVEFLTPKSREKGKEESLLDKFDEKVTSLEYLVKIAVQRKLIDSSRQNPTNDIRIDNYVDEFGDCITAAFELTIEQDEDTGFMVDLRTFTEEEMKSIKLKFENMKESFKESFYKQYKEVECALAPAYRDLFDFVVSGFEAEMEPIVEEKRNNVSQVLLEVETIGECAVQQITPKTACIFVPTYNHVVDFNRETGEARGKSYKGLKLTETAVNWIKENINIWASGKSRKEFEVENQI